MGRATSNPDNPYLSEQLAWLPGQSPSVDTTVREDDTRSILSHNDSPDIHFDYTLNPYRGCHHGCAYCYARPTHEYFGLGAGTDFVRHLVVKPRAAELLRAAFAKPSWKGDLVVFSGATDCYQPLEAQYGLTRACLEVCLEHRNPVGIITKSPLITRDLELLRRLHQVTHLQIAISIPVWDAERAHAVEPQVATPARRMAALETLASAGLDVSLNVAPFVPGLSEHRLRELLERARDAGARRANFTFLRLPGPVAEVFEAAIRERIPLTAEKILSRVRAARGGRLNDPRFGHRMSAEGPWAEAARRAFDGIAKDVGFPFPDRARPREPSPFRRPNRSGQLALFE